MGRIVTQGELSDILGVTSNTIRAWKGQGLPCISAGRRGQAAKFDTQEVIEWIKNKDAGEGGEVFDYKVEQARLTKLKADNEELLKREKEGSLGNAEDVFVAWSQLLANFRAKILSLPSKLAPELADLDDPREIQGLLKGRLYEALEELQASDADDFCSSPEEE